MIHDNMIDTSNTSFKNDLARKNNVDTMVVRVKEVIDEATLYKVKAYSIERIVSLDFIVCYAGYFQLPYLNPQGDNQYMFSELASRRERLQEAVKGLVVQGLLNVEMDNGYAFSITDAGSKYIRKLKSEYALQYKAIAADAIKRFNPLHMLKPVWL